jgi:hypothetical protein
MLRAAGAESSSAGGGFLERLQAKKLVRIRRSTKPAAATGGAILSASNSVRRGSVAGALGLDKLLPAARGPAQGWIAKAQARYKAVNQPAPCSRRRKLPRRP